MELLEIAKKRFSVRDYTDQKVEPEKLNKILEAAHVAPTAANLQPVHLIVAQSDGALAKVSKAANIYGAPLAIIVCADHNKAWVRPFDKKQTRRHRRFYPDRPHDAASNRTGPRKRLGLLFQAGCFEQRVDLPANLEPVNILVVG